MRKAKFRYILLTLLLALGSGLVAFAQANSELTGIVTDQTGAVVAGAHITLTDPATGTTKATESGPTGLYDINGLNPATYNLKVTAKNFQTFAQNGVVVNVSATVRTDIKLTVGAESQTVTVEADALQVQTDSNVVSTLISSEQISEIATENRNFASLAALGLGVSSALPDSNTPSSVLANFTISVNGLRQSHNIWLIDGGEADDRGGAGGMDIMPSQDAIAEFNMLTSNYPPDYGISSGATMSLSLKSGTQKFHGELFEFNRNTAYDANFFFNKLGGQNVRPALHYNIFGGNIGGPLFIPHVYNSNRQKTFFFWNEEWRKIRNAAGTNIQNTLADADRPVAGTNLTYVAPAFSASNQIHVPNIDPTSYYFVHTLAPLGYEANGCWDKVHTKHNADGTAFCDTLTGQVIPASLFDPNGVLYLNSPALPRPNSADDKAVSANVVPLDVRDDVLRIDHKFNDKWAVLGHYMHDTVTQGSSSPFLGWLWASYNSITSTLSNPSNSAAIKLSGTINPNLLIEGSINYDGNVIDIVNSSNAALPSGWSVSPVSGLFQITRNALPGVGYLGPYGTAEDTGSAPWHNAAQDYEPKVDVSYTKGKHAMKYGFSYNRYTKNQQIFGDSQGNYSPTSSTGDSAMDILLGLTSGYSQFQETPIRHYVNQTPSAYVLDNWHVTPRLSLQLGFRYDALPHAWERSNAVATFYPASYNQAALPIWTSAGTIDPSSPGIQTIGGIPFYLNGMGLAGQNGFPPGLVKNDYKTYQPRIGFSEDLTGNGRTVLRGGFGTFFERMQGNDIYNTATAPPFSYNLSLGNTLWSQPGFNWQTGGDASVGSLPVFATGGYQFLAHDYRAPGVAQYSLGVQHEVIPSMIAVVQYVGNLAWHQNVEVHRNNITPEAGFAKIDAGKGTTTVACLGGDNENHSPFGNDAACVPGLGHFNAGTNAFRQYQGYGDLTSEENDTNGTYNGFQTGLRIQNKWGLSGEIDYTYSHEIDITTYDLNTVSNPWNMKYDKGSGALDRRHMLSMNYVYKLPIFAKGTGLTHSLIGGWEVAGTIIDEAGTPVTVTGAGGCHGADDPYPGCHDQGGWDPVGLGGGYTVRPNVTGKPKYNKKMNSWFDTSNFSSVIPQWQGGPNLGFGNAGKDYIVGPGRVNFTTSLYKSFAMTERARFELRFESFNTFNHTEPNGVDNSFDPQNGGFSTNLNTGNTFGQITSTQDPRVLELGGKFIF